MVNADSQQLYDGLRILTARPSPDDEALAPHFLYGVADLAAPLHGDLGLADAIDRMKTQTRRYAKRQLNWFRNQTPDWPRLAIDRLVAS